MKKHSILPVDIQLFAEDPPATQDPPGGSPPPAGDPPKTFTQEEVNGIVAKESKSAVEKLLKDAGIAPEGDYKASMKAFKDWQDSQKTELEKRDGALSAAQKEKAESDARAAALEKKLDALSKGIPADKAGKYIKLAEAYTDEKTDFSAALDLALKDFPLTASGVPGAGGNPPPPKPGTETTLPKGTVVF